MIKYLIIAIIILFSKSSILSAEIVYLNCNEQVTNIRVGNDLNLKIGKKISNHYIKLNKNSNYNKISVIVQSNDKNKLIEDLIKEENTKKVDLGFNFIKIDNKGENKREIFYDLFLINGNFFLNKREFFWSSNKSYDFDSGGKCLSINKAQFLELDPKTKVSEINKEQTYKWSAQSGHPKGNKIFLATELSTEQKAINLAMKKCYAYVTKFLNKKGYNDCYLSKTSDGKLLNKEITTNDVIKGVRKFALYWEGFDELIMGSLNFTEKKLVGTITFALPGKENNCVGSYILLDLKGTWSVICANNNLNASGFLKINKKDYSIIGNGKDNNMNKVKFTIEGPS
jgi:hypothetical protein